MITDEPRFDAAGSMVIGVLLAGIGLLLAFEMKGLLIGESPSAEEWTSSARPSPPARTSAESSR